MENGMRVVLETLGNEISSLKASTDWRDSKIKTLEKSLESAEKERKEKSAEVDELLTEIDRLRQENKSLRNVAYIEDQLFQRQEKRAPKA
nr:hypothetical protein [uncultured Sphaerochaeta sp.]